MELTRFFESHSWKLLFLLLILEVSARKTYLISRAKN
jgi:hypothetical protein